MRFSAPVLSTQTRRGVLTGLASAGLVTFAAGSARPAAAAIAPFGTGRLSGMPWHSGCQLNKIAEFEAYRGRLADIYTIWSRRANWGEITDIGASGFSAVRKRQGRISYGLAMLPETHHAGKNPGNWRLAAKGSFDRYYDSVAKQLGASGVKDLVVRIGWESNDRSSPWFGGSDPENFKATFRRIAEIMRRSNPTCAIEWCNVKDGAQAGSIETLYPGDGWVDIIGVNYYDGYPAINTESAWAAEYKAKFRGGPRGIGAWLDYARSRGKKFAVSEWGIWRGRPGTTDSSLYIRKMYEFFRSCGADLAYENYFNQIAKHQINPANLNPKASAEYRRLWGR